MVIYPSKLSSAPLARRHTSGPQFATGTPVRVRAEVAFVRVEAFSSENGSFLGATNIHKFFSMGVGEERVLALERIMSSSWDSIAFFVKTKLGWFPSFANSTRFANSTPFYPPYTVSKLYLVSQTNLPPHTSLPCVRVNLVKGLA